jgi:hypothetical protein
MNLMRDDLELDDHGLCAPVGNAGGAKEKCDGNERRGSQRKGKIIRLRAYENKICDRGF